MPLFLFQQRVSKVKGPVHPRWPVQPHPGDHQGKVGMNTTTPGDKEGTP